MNLVLHNLKEKDISTSKGPAKLWGFKSGDTYYNAFQGSWNADWCEGMEIDIPDDRIKVVTKDDKTFHNIQEPPASEQKAKAKSDLQTVISGVRECWKDLQVVKRQQADIMAELKIIRGSMPS